MASEAGSANCRSSRKSRPGAVSHSSAEITWASPSCSRCWAPGPSPAGWLGAAQLGHQAGRLGPPVGVHAGQPVGRRRRPPPPAARPRSARTAAPLRPRGCGTGRPCRRPPRIASSACSHSRVLPTPGSPSTTTSRPPARPGSTPAASSSSSASRPTRPSSATATAGSGRRSRSGHATGSPSLTASYRALVSGSGRTPSSWSSTRTQLRYWASASARWPVTAYSRISARWAGSCSGSRASRRWAGASAWSARPVACQLGHQPLQRQLQLAPQLGPGRPLPVVEGGAVAQAEAGQQVAPVQRHRLGQVGDRAWAVAGRGHQPPEPPGVHRVGLQLQPHRRPVGDQPAAVQRRSQHRQRAPQRRPSAVGIGVRPQQVDQQVARVAAAAHRQVRQQRRGLARVHPKRRAVHLDPGRAQHVNPKGHVGREYRTAFGLPVTDRKP